MSRFEFHPVTREPFLQEPRPAGATPSIPQFSAATTVPASGPDSGRQVGTNTVEPPSPDEVRIKSIDASHQQERTREEQGNRGPEEEVGFGEGV